MTTISDILNRLTGNYTKEPDSNTVKLLGISANQIDLLVETIEKVGLWRVIDEAEGAALDLIGSNVGEDRGGKGDTEYRDYIKVRIVANLSSGEIERINQVGQVLIGDVFYGVREGWRWNNDPLPPQPAAIDLTVSPVDDDTPLSIPFVPMSRVISAGVALYWRALYQRDLEITSAYEAQFATQAESELEITSAYSVHNMYRDVRICGTFAAGEEVVL